MADSLIAKLDIALRGNTQNLDNGLDQSSKRLNQFRNKVNESAQGINTDLSNVGNGVSSAFQNALTNPIQALQSMAGSIGQAVLHPIQTMKSGISGLLSTFKAIGDGILGSIKSTLGALVGYMKAAINPQSWVSGFQSMASGVSYLTGALFSLEGVMAVVATGIGAVVVIAVAAVAAFAGLGAGALMLANQQSKVIGDMHKTAQTLGMTTTAFSGLASTSGMEVEQFATGVEHLERTLSQAAMAGGETAAALGRLGLEAQTLVAQSPEQQLRSVANAMQGMTNQADRLRLSQELFGRGAGAEFTRALSNGAAGLDALQARAERFGLAFTAEQGETVRRANKVWGEWSLGLQGIGRGLAVAFAPAWEYIGNIVSNVFAKIQSWVRAALPYITMIWQEVKKVADDIQAALAPVWEWLESSLATIATSLGSFIQGAIPFIRQGWNIIKSVFEVAFDILKALWQAFVALVLPIVESFISTIRGWFSSLGGFLTGEHTACWQSFKDWALRALITMEFGVRNLARIMSFVWDSIKLKMFEWLQALAPFVQGFERIINAIIDGLNSLTRGVIRGLNAALVPMVETYNSIADRLNMRRITLSISPDDASINRVNMRVQDMTDRIRQLRADVDRQREGLGADLQTFINTRLEELNRVNESISNNVREQERATQSQTGQGSKDNKAAEKGSVEAFAIIAGDKGDKQFQALNTIAAEFRTANDLNRQQLRELQNRFNVAVARL